MAAEEAARLAAKNGREVIVVASDSQQGSLAALVEFDPAETAGANAERLDAGLGEVRVGAVAPAARDDAEGRFRRGDSVGFADGELVAWGGAGSTLIETVAALADEAEIVTVIEGAEAPIALAELRAGAGRRDRARAPARRHPELLLADRRSVTAVGAAMTLLDDVIEAHGGRAAWERARAVRARVRSRRAAVAHEAARQPLPRGSGRGADRRAGLVGGAVPARRGPRRLRPRRGPARDRRRRVARVARAPARALLRAPAACGATCAGTRSTPPTSPATRGGTTSTPRISLPVRTYGSPRSSHGTSAARPGAGSRLASPRVSTRTRRCRRSTSTRR